MYTPRMSRERTITKLELIPALVAGKKGWVHAKWERSDGSKGKATARFRPMTAERWYIATLHVDLPTTELLRDVPLARIARAANADPKIRAWLDEGTNPEVVKLMRRAAAKRPRLKRPAARRLDDDFYKQVADAYRGAVAHGLQPAKTLAEDSETPQGTVNRWIATAREKHLLADAEPGKVTI